MCARSTEEIGKGFRLEDNRFAFKQRLAKIKGAFHEYGTLKISFTNNYKETGK